jgi:hypothetical protein
VIHYTSIYDCPAWNFTKASEDPRYLLRLDSYNSLPDTDTDALGLVYETIYYQFLNEFGVNGTEAEMLHIQRDILELEIDYMRHGGAVLQVRLNVLRKRLEELADKNKGGNIFEVAAALSKWAGYDVSPMKLTVVEFYSKLKLYEKANEKR